MHGSRYSAVAQQNFSNRTVFFRGVAADRSRLAKQPVEVSAETTHTLASGWKNSGGVGVYPSTQTVEPVVIYYQYNVLIPSSSHAHHRVHVCLACPPFQHHQPP
jgi:hypothetical protein